MRIRLLPEAEKDLEIGADFYESHQPGLGTYFNECLTADIESLRLYVGIHEAYRGFQRSLSKRFPFSIYYIVREECIDMPLIRGNSITGHLYIGIQNFSLKDSDRNPRIGAEVIINKWKINGHTIDFNLKVENGIFGNSGESQPEATLFLNTTY